jgi:FkbM family methyltransferase
MENHNHMLNQFFSNGGDDAHLYNFSLNSTSVIFDIGSFDGEYFNVMYAKYKCTIHAFEPVESFYLQTNVNLPQKIKLNNFALGKENSTFTIAIAGNASSAFLEGNRIECKKVNFTDYIRDNKVETIDLLKVNCEGGEYELLETIISSGYIKNISNIIVQFHYLSDEPEVRRQIIVDALEKTHDVVFSYSFVWEGWKLKTK